MTQEAEGALRREIELAENKPPVITLEEVSRRVAADSLTRARLAQPVTALNAALVHLGELHRQQDAAAGLDPTRRVDTEAYPVHLAADRYENEIHALLTSAQHQRFHRYLAERLQAAGLPPDTSHGVEGVGTAGNVGGLEHSEQAGKAGTRRGSGHRL